MKADLLPPTAPQRPMQGGRDAGALQARSERRLGARAAVGQRQAGEAPLQRVASLTTLQPDDAAPVAGHVRSGGTRLRTTFDAIFRRSVRTRSR